MIITEQNEELIRHFLEQLESYGIEIGTKLDQMEKEKQSYHFFDEIRKKLQESKENFCTHYLIMTEEEQTFFQKRLLDLFKDQEIVDNILQEIVNLYYLSETGLIDLEEASPQKEIAYENLETLMTKIEKYLSEINLDQITIDSEQLSTSIDRLVELGSIMEGEEDTPIDDIDFLEEILESSNFSQEEKKALLLEIIQYNLKTYKKMAEKNNREQNENKKVEEDLTISSDKIHELLSRREIVERIVRIVNDDYGMMINITSPTIEEKEQIESSIEIAEDEIKQSIQQDRNLTPAEALEQFFKKYDESKRNKERLVEIIFHDAPKSDLPLEKQIQVVKEGINFFQENKGLISTLPRQDKERINQYTQELYQQKDNRKTIYISRAFTSPEQILKEATYEIQILKELLEVVEEGTDYYSKISRRISEILECVKETVTEKDSEKKEDISEGNIFFLENDGETQLEEDLRLNKAKGISSSYLKEIKNQLVAIETRNNRILVSAQPVNPSYKFIKKQGVRYTMGPHTKVFFIPVGKKDAIIIGAGLSDEKDNLKAQDVKVKRLTSQIEELKERLMRREEYREEVATSKQAEQRIYELLDQKELEDMFEESAPTQEIVKK